ncbi:NAD-dependent epimerase [Corynebacterium sp. CNJ-954]|uniref:NAD-dependent epimerase/dehydratase family protein n=1 Tax=Corynebacterium sp. CNJ-954 TaxID=1904962 RepID=UPI00096025F8|nr:NAD-dependent epimerase/dehydratase family protein [Corynebacterium sp. CNJ-954]OLT54430.1 NAD-dependent epimerase [Corynebacterium sp. CNJ-954]
MKIFVIGATGYAGRHISTALARAGHRVQGLTRDSFSPIARRLTEAEVDLVQGDVSDPSTWRAHLAAADVLIHAMMDLTDPAGTDRRVFEELSALQDSSGRAPHIVYTTGISSYGRTGSALMDELTPGNPDSPLAFRFGLETELAASGLAHTIVRPGFLYGGSAATSMTSQWFAAAESGTPVFYGDPTKRWSWVHVDDLAEAYARIVDHLEQVRGEVFVIADDQRLSALDMQNAAIRAAGYNGEITLAAAEDGGMMQMAADQDELASSAKARRLLDWRPRHISFTDNPERHYQAWQAATAAI